MTKILTCALVLACCGPLAAAQSTEEAILAMEQQGMDGWRQGRPDKFLEISDSEIVLFHSALGQRLFGLDAVKAVYEGYRGQPLFDQYEIVSPRVVASPGMAVLTYELVPQNGSLRRYWNATEVYRKGKAGWRIVHSHFSSAKP
jgi:ketosteroid isomerase-like protein